MRVLLTTDTLGGVWTFTQSLVTELLEQGHHAALISFGRHASNAQQRWCTTMQRDYASRFEYTSSGVPLEWMSDNAHAYSRGVLIILALAARFQPDIVHSSQFCFGRLPLQIPVLVTAHSDVLSWAAACRPKGLLDSPWLLHYKSLVQAGLDDAATVVAPTNWMLKALQEGFSFTAPVRTILNGQTLTAPESTGTRHLQAVSVGRLWDEAKNLTLLATTTSPIPILVAGELQHEACATNTDLGVLTVLGHLDDAELLGLFARSSIYIAPSIYEPFGLAPLEAALCGCAIVAHDIPSLREVWRNAALYFSDTAALNQILVDLSNSEQRLINAQQRSLDRAYQLTSRSMADQYIALYTSLLQSQERSLVPERATHAC